MFRRPRLDVRWSNHWSREMDAALAELPEMPTCSRELYQILAHTPSPTQKRFALVREGETPVAVIGLRRRHRHWQLLCQGVVPFASAPAMPGRLWEAVSALGVYVRVFEWHGAAPEARALRFVERSARYTASTRVDFEAYWRAKGNREWLKKARRRTEALGAIEFEVDGRGAAQWTIEGWRRTWDRDPMGETDATEDILAAAGYLTERGQYRTFRLLIDGTPVAGVNTFALGSTLVMTHSYRDRAYDRAGVGVHLDEQIFRWSQSSPYDLIDLGCGGGYKQRWGEIAGEATTFGIAPAHLAIGRAALGLVRGLRRGRQSAKHDITTSREARSSASKQKLDNAV